MATHPTVTALLAASIAAEDDVSEPHDDQEADTPAPRTRADWNDLAASLGVPDPDALPNIAAVKAAVKEASA